MAKRKVVKRVAAWEPVTIPGTKISMPRRPGQPGDRVPKMNPHYVFRSQYVEEVAWAIEAGENIMLCGDTSTGKSSLIEQMAAQTNTPLRRYNIHGESDTTIFVGRDKPKKVDGQAVMEYLPGILARAMLDGEWLLLDEIDAALQPVLFVLQQVLEDNGALTLEDDDATIVRKHEHFRLFATSNTVGAAGRHKLLYTGTMGRMNEATLDRFGVVIHLPYLEAEDEVKVISAAVPKLDIDFVQAIVRIANNVRSQMEQEQLSCTMGTRRCIHWAKAMQKFHPMRAAKFTILNKLDADDAKVLEGVIQRYFGS